MLELIACALATWRVSHMLLYESGPWDVFWNLRERLGVVYDYNTGEVVSWRYEITQCLWCLSVWVGLVFTVLYAVGAWVVSLPFALSAIAIGIQNVTGGENGSR